MFLVILLLSSKKTSVATVCRGLAWNQLEMIRFCFLTRTVAFFLAKVSKHLPNFLSEERTHEAVNIHVQSSVSDQTKMTDVDRNECPGCKWGHPSFFAHMSVLQCEYFMYINANLKLRINLYFGMKALEMPLIWYFLPDTCFNRIRCVCLQT